LNGFNFEESAGSHQDDENIGTFLDEFEFDGSNDGESDSFFEQDEDNIGTFVDEFIEDNFSDDEFGNSTDSLFFGQDLEDEDFSNEFNDPADGLFLGQRGEEGIFSPGFDENLNSEFEEPTDKLFFNQNENVGSFLDEFDRDDSANDRTLFFEPGEENVGTYLNEYVGDNLRDNQFENPTDSLLLGQENEFYGNEEESYEDIITHALERAELLRIRDEEIEFTEEELEAFKEIAVQMDEEAMLENNPAGDFLAALALFPGVGIANRGFNGRSINTVAETQAFAARISTAKQWSFGGHKSELQWSNRMQSRGWTNKEIVETIRNGKPFPAQNKVNPGNGATRYENPETGKFLVVDDVTNELIQVSRKGDFFPSK